MDGSTCQLTEFEITFAGLLQMVAGDRKGGK